MLSVGKIVEVKESIRDKHSLFNVKRFKLGDLLIERPKKVLDAKNVRYEHIRTLLSRSNPIFEKSLFVDWNGFCRIIETDDSNKIKRHLGFPHYTNGFSRYISITFTFNPFKQVEDRAMIEKYLEDYLMYYQAYSTSALLVPNMKAYSMVMTIEGKKRKETIITLSEFINAVDTMYNILDYRNNKPIFVPLSLKFSMSDVSRLALHYIKREYYNIWIDFEGRAVTEDRIARIRRFVLEYDKRGLFNQLVMIATNVRREIISNVKEDFTPASDVLTSIIGANIIGVNREPLRPIEGVVVERSMLLEHKARVFDADTYYYFKVTKTPWLEERVKKSILLSKGANITFNAMLLDKEFNNQAAALINSNTVREYLRNKKMLQEYKDGSLFKELFREMYAGKDLTSWF